MKTYAIKPAINSQTATDQHNPFNNHDQQPAQGFEPLPLDIDLLLKRIAQSGYSGQFLADAFLSAYRPIKPFAHLLHGATRLDNVAFSLFIQIICLRRLPGWNDESLHQIEQQIKAIVKGGKYSKLSKLSKVGE